MLYWTAEDSRYEIIDLEGMKRKTKILKAYLN